MVADGAAERSRTLFRYPPLSFTNALAVSLFALVPGTNPGFPAVVLGVIGLVFTAAAIRSVLARTTTAAQRSDLGAAIRSLAASSEERPAAVVVVSDGRLDDPPEDPAEPALRALGRLHFLGEDAGRAAVVDAALIAFFYGTMAGFLQCVTLATAEGVPVGDLLELSGPFFQRFIANAVTETGERIAERRYGEPQSSLDTHLDGIDLLVLGSSREAGIDTGVVTAIKDSFARAVAAGHGADDIAILGDTEPA